MYSLSNGRFKLHDMYMIDTKANAIGDSSLWIPIDHKVMTPFHQVCNRVPGMFPPACFIKGTVRELAHNVVHFEHEVNPFLP